MSIALRPDAEDPVPVAGADVMRLLPLSRGLRLGLWLAIAVAVVLVFAAWLRPNMVFDFADMVFCN